MKQEDKLNLNAGEYAIRHCVLDQTYNGFDVHKMLCDAYIAGNNDNLDDGWKPSEEQLNNILDILSFDNCTPKRQELLKSLYEQLKNLK